MLPTFFKTKSIWGVAGIVALLGFWELAARAFDSDLILPGPLTVMLRLADFFRDPQFYAVAMGTFGRVVLGLFTAVPISLVAGIAIGLSPGIHDFSRPFFAVIGATPVLSIILIALLWFGQDRMPIFTAFLMIFPLLTANVAEGIGAVDPKLLEMVDSYRLPRAARIRFLYLPTLTSFFFAGLRGSLALAWKVVVAAEVIAQPHYSLGAGMQNAKAQLETADLFAWTVATVVLAAISEIIFTALRPLADHHHSVGMSRTAGMPSTAINVKRSGTDYALILESISFAYSAVPVFKAFSACLASDRTTAILGPSGCGKSTLLRLIAGLIHPQDGRIDLSGVEVSVAIVFQEPRLLPWRNLRDNVAIPLIEKYGKSSAVARADKLLAAVGLADRIAAFPDELSGGQRQRVSLARAFAFPAPLVLMDEPFQSLDLPLRIQLMDLCTTLLAAESRGAIFVTHDPREAIYLADRVLVLSDCPARIVLDEAIVTERSKRTYASSAIADMESRLLTALA